MLICLVLVQIVLTVASEPTKNVPQFKEKPDWMSTCKRDAPTEDNCFLEFFQDLIPVISEGVPQQKIEPFEPLTIPKIAVHREAGQIITLTGSFDDVQVRGPSNATVSKAYLNLEKKIMNFSLDIPRLRLNASYNLKGNILLLPLIGSGDVTILLKNIKTSINTRISLRKMPEEAIYIDAMKVKFNVGAMRIHLGNLFNNNQVLSASFHMFINQNSKEILDELKEGIENGLADIFVGVWNSIFNKMPLKFWLE